MEDALGVAVLKAATSNVKNCLNPCCNGRCSRSGLPEPQEGVLLMS